MEESTLHTSTEVFRFMAVRSPQKYKKETLARTFISLDLSAEQTKNIRPLDENNHVVNPPVNSNNNEADEDSFRDEYFDAMYGSILPVLFQARNTGATQSTLANAVNNFVRSIYFVPNSDSLENFFAAYHKIYSWFLNHAHNPRFSDLKKCLESALDMDAKKYVGQSENFLELKLRLWENYLIQYLSHQKTISSLVYREMDAELFQELTYALRILYMIERIANGDESLNSEKEILEAMSATIILPAEIFPLEIEDAETRDVVENPTTRKFPAIGKKVVEINGSLIEVDYGNTTINATDAESRDVPTPIRDTTKPWAIDGKRYAKFLGVGDLKLVKTQLLMYQAGEVAHIENVLKGESRKRTLRVLDKLEETNVLETESDKSAEIENQTTDSYKLNTEAQNSLKTDFDLKGGVEITGDYGTVKVKMTTNVATAFSKQESNKTSSEFAKTVVNKAVNKIHEKIKQSRTLKTTSEKEDITVYELNNGTGTGNVTGVYRWLDKYYVAKVVNYGKRAMYEFILPEPAANYIFLKAVREADASMPKRYSHPYLLPNENPGLPDPLYRVGTSHEVSKYNYEWLAAYYDLADYEAYPVEEVYIDFQDNHCVTGEKPDGRKNGKGEIVIPDGYRADTYNLSYSMYAGVEIGHPSPEHTTNFMEIMIGSHFAECKHHDRRDGVFVPIGPLEGKIPVSYRADSESFAFQLWIRCVPSERKIKQWQQKFHVQIMAAYNRGIEEYQSWLRSKKAYAGISIQGNNPEINRKTEQQELKKSCIEMMTGQHFEVFDAMGAGDVAGNKAPIFDTNDAINEGKFIQFFEQAFEWSNMAYRMYPYFWGRKANWQSIVNMSDPDPLFDDFLKAGAARVILPVRPGYEDAVRHYMSNGGNPWPGGDTPVLDSTMHISLAEEMKEQADNWKEKDVIDKWIVKIPTTLVMLEDLDQKPKLPDNRLSLLGDKDADINKWMHG